MQARKGQCPQCGSDILFIVTGKELQTACEDNPCCVLCVHHVIQVLYKNGDLAQGYPDRWTII